MAVTTPTMRQRELGKRLRDLRAQHNLTVEDVGEKLLCSAIATKARRSVVPVARISRVPKNPHRLCRLT